MKLIRLLGKRDMTTNLTEIFNFKDSNGNKIEYNNGSLILSLSSGYCRHIGNIEVKPSGGLTFYKELSSKKHILRANKSIGFAYNVINKLGENDSIWIRLDKKKVYKINAQKARDVGSFLWFKRQGFEQQYFVPLEHFSKV
jgi:hypothetical protein